MMLTNLAWGNLEIKVGRLVRDAQLFSDNHGGWKLVFRLAVPSVTHKASKPQRMNFFAVVAYDPRRDGQLVQLQPLLREGLWVVVIGAGQSRDIVERNSGSRRVVVETVAYAIVPLPTTDGLVSPVAWREANEDQVNHA